MKISKEDEIKYLNQLQSLQTLRDTEVAHSEADDILCEILTEMGYNDIVKAYETINKWYA